MDTLEEMCNVMTSHFALTLFFSQIDPNLHNEIFWSFHLYLIFIVQHYMTDEKRCWWMEWCCMKEISAQRLLHLVIFTRIMMMLFSLLYVVYLSSKYLVGIKYNHDISIHGRKRRSPEQIWKCCFDHHLIRHLSTVQLMINHHPIFRIKYEVTYRKTHHKKKKCFQLRMTKKWTYGK